MLTTGIDSLDDLLAGGLQEGDNIVWLADDARALVPFVDAFTASDPERSLRVELGAGAQGSSSDLLLSDPDRLGERLLASEVGPGWRVAVVSFDDLVTSWGAEAAADLYVRTCPRLFDRGAVAYWTVTRDLIGGALLERISRVAQCVFELRGDRIRVRKAEGRPARVQGATASVTGTPGDLDGAAPVVSREHTVGRLGEGLRRLRTERGWSQAQLAAAAGVTPAAISQAENGRRGLSLDTLVPLCESLDVSLDDLVGIGRRPDPWLGRRDRTGDPTTPLFADAAGLRVHSFALAPGQSGSPPLAHKGTEMVLAGTGLVLVDLGEWTPVLRAGDGALVTDVAVRGWSNLGPEEARVFWIAL